MLSDTILELLTSTLKTETECFSDVLISTNKAVLFYKLFGTDLP